MEPVLRASAQKYGATYVDGRGLLCNAQGCLARLGEGIGDLVNWDREHLTERGSRYVVEHLPIPRDAR
jgi:hypothetical protein